MDKHDVLCALKKLAVDLGRVPSRDELRKIIPGGDHTIRRLFGTYAVLLQAADLKGSRSSRDPETVALEANREAKLLKAYRAICGKREQIQGFFRTTLDLKDMFARAGNPPVLKLSAQPDTHVKFIHRPAFNAYLKFLAYFKPHVHLIMGDFMDCEGLSHWPSDDMEPRRIVPEAKVGRAVLQEIVDHTPGCSTRLFLEGNHERWIEMAFTQMPQLFDGLAELGIEINLKTLLALEKFGYQLFPLNEIVRIGQAHFTHGIYHGENHARKHLKVFKDSMYYGHLHDTQQVNETSMDGNIEASCLGCLCRLDAKFLKGKPNNWVHASGVFEFFPDGSYNFYKPQIFAGRMAFNGVVFDGNEPLTKSASR